MAQNAILQAIATTSNLGRKRSLVMTGACIAHVRMWVSLCTINNVQCVWMRPLYLAEGKVTLCCGKQLLEGKAWDV